MNELYLNIILGILVVAAIAQLAYYAFLFSRLAFYKPKPVEREEHDPVSIIISARNEYSNLEKNLKKILEQDYPDFEVVVVNDCSWDESQKLLEYYQEVYPHLKVCQLIEQEKYPTGKKFAITIGVKAAKNNLFLFTDADCIPAGNQWLRLMQRHFVPGTEIVLGYSPYKTTSGLLNLFIRYEAAMTGLLYISAALAKKPFMGIGRNLAYTRDLFFRHKGFATHQHIASGDDDLFVNEAATPGNVAIELSPEAFMYSDPKESLNDWIRQKSRHNTTGRFYKPASKMLLGAYFASLMLFYAALLSLLPFQHKIEWVLGVYVLKLLTQVAIFYPAFKRLKAGRLALFIPLFDLLYAVYLLIFGTKGLFARNRKRW